MVREQTTEKPEELTNEKLFEAFKEYTLQTREESPYVLSNGEGATITDVEGNSFLDFESGQICVATGHCHPGLVEILAEQGGRLVQTSSKFTSVPQVQLAERLIELLGPPFSKSVFASTGSESNEIALRIAKKYTENFEVAGLIQGYSGTTLGSISASGFGPVLRKDYGPTAPGTFFLPPPDLNRLPFDTTGEILEYSRHQIEQSTSGDLAAVIMEPILSAGGVLVPSEEYMEGIREICDDYNGLLIFDEAQTGIGRTGEWFAFEHFSITPDIVTTSKGIGGGIALSATSVTEEIADEVERKGIWQSSSHTNDPLPCAYGLKNIEIIEEEDLLENTRNLGRYFTQRLRELEQDYDTIHNPRGLGLILGFDIEDPTNDYDGDKELVNRFTDLCRRDGLHLGTAFYPSRSGIKTIRLAPPLNIEKDTIDQAIDIMEGCLTELEAAIR